MTKPEVATPIAELRRLLEKATPQPWSYESIGEKGDGSERIGVYFGPDDTECERPITGRIDADVDENGEFLEYFCDEVVADCEHRNRNPSADARLIVAAVNALPVLLDELDAARAEVERLRACADGRHLDVIAAAAEVDAENARLRECLRELHAWANGYVNPSRGMGSGIHAEMWPILVPSAARELLRRTAAALGESHDCH